MNDFYPVILFPKWYNEHLERRIGIEDVFPNMTMPSKPSIMDLEDYLAKKEKEKQKLKSDYSILIKIDEQRDIEVKKYQEGVEIKVYFILILIVICGFIVLYQLGLRWVITNLFFLYFGIPLFFLVHVLIIDPLLSEIQLKRIYKIKEKFKLERTITFQELKKENDKILLNDTEKRLLTEEFHKEIDAYNIAYNLWSRKIHEFNNNRSIKETYLYDKLQLTATSLRESILRRSTILTQNMPKEGTAEEYFFNLLRNLNDYTVYRTIKFEVFYPDFILLHKESNIFIDIEIDEPYSYQDRLPIHYDDIDENRNNYFTDNGFFVIRFSEDQIVYNTKMCINVIEDCINSVKRSFNEYDFFRNSKSYNVIKCKAWNYEEAFNMAFNNSRKNIVDDIRKIRL